MRQNIFLHTFVEFWNLSLKTVEPFTNPFEYFQLEMQSNSDKKYTDLGNIWI